MPRIIENCSELKITVAQMNRLISRQQIYGCPDDRCGRNVYHIDPEYQWRDIEATIHDGKD